MHSTIGIGLSLTLLAVILPINRADELSSETYEVREHSLVRPYPNVFSTAHSHWHLVGNTIVTDRYVRLTFDDQSKAGGLWNSIPVTYPDWEMHVNFKVHGESKQLFGDGFAIWYAKDPRVTGPVFGYKDYFYGMGIVMDTYANDERAEHRIHPYISVMINNGTLHYDHDRDGQSTIASGCSSPFRDRATETSVAIRYQNERLTVSTDTDGTNTWTECFVLNGVRLPTMYHFGFSAATGELSDNHDIISVHTYRLESSNGLKNVDRSLIVPSAPMKNSSETNHVKPSVWSTIKIFLRVVVVILVCAAGAVGLYLYYFQNRRYFRPTLY